MLRRLTIRDFALIAALDVRFEEGLTVVTGETGAGKSIVVDAFSLLLGERASGEMVRAGCEKAFVEGTFGGAAPARVAAMLARGEIDAQPELVIRREISAKGTSRCFVNDTPAPLALLKDLGDLLVDLHGQHEHQSLLRADTHIHFLDAFAGVEKNLELYRASYDRYTLLLGEIRALRANADALRERTGILRYQLDEIATVDPQPGEDEELDTMLRRAEHAEQMFTLSQEALGLLFEGEPNAHDMLAQAMQRIASLAAIDPSFESLQRDAEGVRAGLDELASIVRRHAEHLDVDPLALDKARERLFNINTLKRRHGGTMESLLARRADLERELATASDVEGTIADLETQAAEVRARCADAARRLRDMRLRARASLEKSIVNALKDLGMPAAKVTVDITTRDAREGEASVALDGKTVALTDHGVDVVEFLMTANPGEPLRPLAKVASGGEVSRIMLAVKSALAAADDTPLLVFDEIDVGISGRVAQKVGAMMRGLAKHHQVIAITHLPQIAGNGHAHFVVEKATDKGRTTTSMRALDSSERITEIAKLLSGEKVTEASLRSARELIVA